MKEGYSTFYVINIVSQSIFTLLWQIGVAVFLGWLLVNRFGAPDWAFVPVILVGVGTGLVSMVRFVLTAMKALESLEREKRKKKKKIEDDKNEK